MTPEETGALLALAAAYDQRTVGKTDILAWHAVLGDLLFSDVQAAVFSHYRDSTDRIMPAHIRRAVDEVRAQRSRSVSDEALMAGVDANAPGYVPLLQRRRAAIRDGTTIAEAVGQHPAIEAGDR